MIWNSASFINTVVKEFKEAMRMRQDRNCRGKSVSVKTVGHCYYRFQALS